MLSLKRHYLLKTLLSFCLIFLSVSSNNNSNNNTTAVVKKSKATFVQNVQCSPQPAFVPTDPLNYFRYTPAMIKLFRCQGADSPQDLHFKRCQPSDEGMEDIDILVMNNNYGTPLTITVKNHTSCGEKCSIDDSSCSSYQVFQTDPCVCKCQFDKAPEPYPCQDPFFWEPAMCDCVCGVDSKDCDGDKEFNERTCKCECKLMTYVRCARSKRVVDEKSCKCVEAISA